MSRKDIECEIVEEASEIAFRVSKSFASYLARLDDWLSYRLSKTDKQGNLKGQE